MSTTAISKPVLQEVDFGQTHQKETEFRLSNPSDIPIKINFENSL